MAKDLAIVLNNGSMNSAVITSLASQRHRPIMLFADTGLAASRARAAYDQQIAHFKPYREHTLPMSFLAGVRDETGTLATDARGGLLLARQLLDLLPLVAAAGRFAAQYQAAAVYLGLRIGPQGDDLAQATEYVQVWNELLQLPCGQPELEIITPLLELEAWQVIDVGFQVAAPFEKTWNCVEEGADPCWSCRGCRAREMAFQQAGKPDPLRLARKS